jgi:hypothetical protein
MARQQCDQRLAVPLPSCAGAYGGLISPVPEATQIFFSRLGLTSTQICAMRLN